MFSDADDDEKFMDLSEVLLRGLPKEEEDEDTAVVPPQPTTTKKTALFDMSIPHQDEVQHFASEQGVSVASLLHNLDKSSQDTLMEKIRKAAPQIGQGALATPLEKPAANKLQREVAAGQTKEHLTDQWEGVVHKLRTADQLIFPAPRGPEPKLTTNEMVANFAATSSLELDIAAVLRESGVDEESINQYSELPKKLSFQDQVAHNKEMAKLRSILFFKQKKDKRTKAIKSKTFRRINKKEKAAASKLQLEQMLQFNPEMAKAELARMEHERITERMTLKHKNTSKWARETLQRGKNMDPESRRAIQESMARSRELTKKMQSVDSDDDFEDTAADIDDDAIDNAAADAFMETEEGARDDDPEEVRRRKLAHLLGEPDLEMPKKGLFAMKFMQRAMDRTIKEIEEDRAGRDRDDYEDYQEEAPTTTGRRKYGAVAAPSEKDVDPLDELGEDAPKKSAPGKPAPGKSVPKKPALFEVEAFADDGTLLLQCLHEKVTV